MTISEYLIESISRRKTGNYFPEKPDIDIEGDFLRGRGFKKLEHTGSTIFSGLASSKGNVYCIIRADNNSESNLYVKFENSPLTFLHQHVENGHDYYGYVKRGVWTEIPDFERFRDILTDELAGIDAKI